MSLTRTSVSPSHSCHAIHPSNPSPSYLSRPSPRCLYLPRRKWRLPNNVCSVHLHDAAPDVRPCRTPYILKGTGRPCGCSLSFFALRVIRVLLVIVSPCDPRTRLGVVIRYPAYLLCTPPAPHSHAPQPSSYAHPDPQPSHIITLTTRSTAHAHTCLLAITYIYIPDAHAHAYTYTSISIPTSHIASHSYTTLNTYGIVSLAVIPGSQ